MKRRDFLKVASGSVASTVLASNTADARQNLEPASEAIGMLFDSTMCVGCKACVTKCKEVNNMPPEIDPANPQYDSARDLSSKTLNIIKLYKGGDGKTKDDEANGFAFEKRSCMHCVDPGCVSVCPVTAMQRDPKTGIVTYNPDVCIGCRVCTQGCPYNVPQFEYENTFGQIQKCQLCNQKGVERIDKGMITGCAEVCPTGATLFGTRKELLEEAKRRVKLKTGDNYKYPRGNLAKPDEYFEKTVVAQYKDHVWGETEGGGTNVMHISSVSFDKLGMPPLKERSAASISEGVQHSLYSYFALPAIVLAGLSFVVHRNTKDDNGDEK